MKKSLLILAITIFIQNTYATNNCFIVKEGNKLVIQEGTCDMRHAPCSTFKIAISLMGYEEGILIDENHPEFPYKKGYIDWLKQWKQPHNPTLWIKNSCVWYSQLITQQLGMNKFKEYLIKFNYGNKDGSGDKNNNNGLTNSWLSSFLEISPEEQIIFLQKLVDGKLPVSLKSIEMTKNILFIEDLPYGWKLYGKTGFGSVLNEEKTKKLEDRKNEWFVGWVKKDYRIIVFANYIEHTDKHYNPMNKEAKTQGKEKLIELIKSL
ncbi:MAG: class D beta-lactamase [Rickettsiaceae bacterium]